MGSPRISRTTDAQDDVLLRELRREWPQRYRELSFPSLPYNGFLIEDATGMFKSYCCEQIHIVRQERVAQVRGDADKSGDGTRPGFQFLDSRGLEEANVVNHYQQLQEQAMQNRRNKVLC